MSIKSDLRAAQEKIRQGWTQEVYARNRSGNVVPPEDSSAVCWCIWGAIHAVRASDATYTFLKRLSDADPLFVFNDSPLRTQAEVLGKMNELIEMAPS